MNNFTGNIFDENGDYIMDATILDNFQEHECDITSATLVEETHKFNESYLLDKSDIDDLDYDSNDEFGFDDVQDDDLEYATNNFIEKNISLFEYLDEDIADFNMLNLAFRNTGGNRKKRRRE